MLASLAFAYAAAAAPPGPRNALATVEDICSDLRLASPDGLPQQNELAAARFAVIIPQLAGLGMTVGALGADGSFSHLERVVPARTQRALALGEPIDLAAYSVTTMLLLSPPPKEPGDRQTLIVDDENVRDVQRRYGVERLAWERAGTATRPAAAAADTRPGEQILVDKILVTVPDETGDAFALWPMTRRTFAVVACPTSATDQDGKPVHAKFYVAERSVSDPLWTLVDTALVAGLLWLASAAAFGPAGGAGPARAWPGQQPAGRLGRLGDFLDPLRFTQDGFGFGSPSRLQIWWFTMIVVTTLTYIFLRAGYLSEISTDVLSLLGISAGGSAIGALVTSYKAADNSALTFRTDRWLKRHAIEYPPRRPRWADLFTSGSTFDVYRFQVVVFSGLIGVWILTSGLANLGDLAIPHNLSTLLGISQAVYVSGKLVGAGDEQKRQLNAAIDQAIRLEQAFWAGVAADTPYRRAAAERGLALGAGLPAGPWQQAPFDDLPPAAKAGYGVFQEAARAAMGLANQVLGGQVRLAEIVPVVPPDDTASLDAAAPPPG